MMWNDKKSLQLSIILVRVFFALIPVLMCCVPIMVHWYETVGGSSIGLLSGSVYFPLCICLYLAAPCGLVCLWALHKLLMNLKKEEVFIRPNCKCLRIISWCCLLVALPFFAFGFWRSVSFLVALAAAFFGLILHVLKNVFDKAVELKEENDYTI